MTIDARLTIDKINRGKYIILNKLKATNKSLFKNI